MPGVLMFEYLSPFLSSFYRFGYEDIPLGKVSGLAGSHGHWGFNLKGSARKIFFMTGIERKDPIQAGFHPKKPSLGFVRSKARGREWCIEPPPLGGR